MYKKLLTSMALLSVYAAVGSHAAMALSHISPPTADEINKISKSDWHEDVQENKILDQLRKKYSPSNVAGGVWKAKLGKWNLRATSRPGISTLPVVSKLKGVSITSKIFHEGPSLHALYSAKEERDELAFSATTPLPNPHCQLGGWSCPGSTRKSARHHISPPKISEINNAIKAHWKYFLSELGQKIHHKKDPSSFTRIAKIGEWTLYTYGIPSTSIPPVVSEQNSVEIDDRYHGKPMLRATYNVEGWAKILGPIHALTPLPNPRCQIEGWNCPVIQKSPSKSNI